jgi:Trk K+ transport system NAD-binding subunit
MTDDDVAAWTGHVVVCGLHDEGLRTIEQLHLAGVRVVAVDAAPDQRLVRPLAALGVPLLAADPRLPETLALAGLTGAVAIVCVEDDDLHTLATALLVRELRPEVRVVVRLGNPAVGRALGGVGVAVLDVASLSAPSVVEACLRTGVHRVPLGAVDLVVAEAVTARAGTLRALYGDLAPIAVVPAAGGEVAVAPGRDHPVAPGDTVVVAGTADEVAAAGLAERDAARRPAEPVFVGARAPRPRRVKPAALLRYVVRGLDRRLRLALLALATLAALSVTMLMVGYQEADGRRMTIVDALYFTVETIGTVGFGDFYFRDQHVWLRLWAVCLMIVGATLATVFFALLTNALISRTIEEQLGRRRMTGLDDHVVVAGLGSVGLRVVDELLERGAAVAVVESDPGNRFLGRLRDRGVPVVVADATLPETLTTLGLARARAVAVVTSDDLVNIETGLAVRDLLGERWAGVPVVLRLFDRRLSRTIAASFGFRQVRSTAALAAPWFVGAALGLDVLGTFYVGDQPMLVARLGVAAGGGLDGRAMRDVSARIRVVRLERADGWAGHPRRDTRFAAGDAAYLVGPYEELLRLLRTDAPSGGDPVTGATGDPGVRG